MPRRGDEVYVHALHRTGLATVEKVRRDGRLVVRFADDTTARVRADQARRTVRTPAPVAPVVRVSVPPLPRHSVIVAREVLAQPKPSTPRDRPYLDWLRTQPCVACAFPHGCDPSHHGRHGMGIKASDLDAVSLCRRCHDHWEQGAPRRILGRENLDEDATTEWLRQQARTLRARYEREERADARH